MIKHFCDICETQLSADNQSSFDGENFRLKASIAKKLCLGEKILSVEVITAKDSTWNDGDFCKYCVLDALYKLDDRPKAA